MITVKDMQIIEYNSPYFGVPIKKLMENAGKKIACKLKRYKHKRVLFVCYHGNNGGDGFAARHFLGNGDIYFIGENEKLSREAKYFYEKVKDNIINKHITNERTTNKRITNKHTTNEHTTNQQITNKHLIKWHIIKDVNFNNYDVIVDCLFGIGFRGKLKEPYVSLVNKINKTKAKKISIDIPSGLDPITGKGNNVVDADEILTFYDVKDGVVKYYKEKWYKEKNYKEKVGNKHADKHAEHKKVKKPMIRILDIGFPKKAVTDVGYGDIMMCFPKRKREAHKGDFGRVLLLSGSNQYPGANVLSTKALVNSLSGISLANLRLGVDLVYVVVTEKVGWVLHTYLPEIIIEKLKGEFYTKTHLNTIHEYIKKSDIVLFGPGIGRHDDKSVMQIINLCMKENKKMVIDADPLRILNFKKLRNCIFTPHKSELNAMLKNAKVNAKVNAKINLNLNSKIKENDIKKIQKIIGNNVILLKGNVDVIISKEKIKYNRTGNPGMTSGGTGDILAGITAGCLAQCNNLFLAACSGAFLSGKAGDEVDKKYRIGLREYDIEEYLPKLLKRQNSTIMANC